MRKSLLVCALALALSASASAGDMQFGLNGTPAPTPTPPEMRAVVGVPSAPGEIPSTGASLTTAVLNVIESVFALVF